MIKCLGCGVLLQNKSPEKSGYVKGELNQSKLCMRCFKIQNYNQYQSIVKTNDDIAGMLQEINNSNDLVLLLIDIFNIPKDLDIITKNINNDLIVVFTKYDLLKPYLSEEKLKAYLNNFNIKYKDIVTISSNKNYNLDNLISLINKYKKSIYVYVIGYTNVGKSTLINKIIYNYSDFKRKVTTSNKPTTTLDNIFIDINDSLTLVDTPGLIDENSIIEIYNNKSLNKIVPNNVLKPVTFQIKKEQQIVIDEFASFYIEGANDITFYLSNKLLIKRVYGKPKNENFHKHTVRVKENQDIVIKGLCFVKFKKPSIVEVYAFEGVDVYTRPSLI